MIFITKASKTKSMRYLSLQILLVIITCPHAESGIGKVFFTPSLPAPGEDVTLHCSFSSSPNMTFLSALPNFFVESVAVGITAIRNRYTVNSVDLSRYSARISTSSNTRYIKANITLHDVIMQDEGIRMGCSAQTTFLSSLTKLLSVNVSEPPLPVDSLRRSPLNPNTCLATLHWDAPYSDWDILSYHIQRDLNTIRTNPSHLLSYNLTGKQPLGVVSSYRIIPESVAGRSEGLSSVLSIYIPRFQFNEITLRVENGIENFLNWTVIENYPDPVTVSYRLDLVQEMLTKHSYAFSTGTTNNRYSFSGVDGNQFVLTLSAYRACEQPLESSITLNEEAPLVSAANPDLVWIIAGSGAAIVLLMIAVLAVLSFLCCYPRKRVTHI